MKSVLVIMAFLAAGSVWADDCPVQFGPDSYLDDVTFTILAAKSCYEAATIAKDCALGASGDYQTTRAAQVKCEMDFARKLNKSEAGHYRRLNNKCTAKYKNMSGSMYTSFAAFCRLSVAELYSELYTPAE